MLSEKNAKFALEILIAILVGVISAVVLSKTVPNSQFIKETIESLEKSRDITVEFSGATLAASLGLSALPGDFASPIAQMVADMNKYFIFILAIIFVEKIIVMEGTKLALTILIPLASAVFIWAIVSKNRWFEILSYKILTFAIALILLIPVSTHAVGKWGVEYNEYVQNTIEDTQYGAKKIDEIKSSAAEGEGVFDKLSNAFNTAISDSEELMEYFKGVTKKCMTAISVIIVSTFAVPILIAFIFKFLIGSLFNINVPTPAFTFIDNSDNKEEKE